MCCVVKEFLTWSIIVHHETNTIPDGRGGTARPNTFHTFATSHIHIIIQSHPALNNQLHFSVGRAQASCANLKPAPRPRPRLYNVYTTNIRIYLQSLSRDPITRNNQHKAWWAREACFRGTPKLKNEEDGKCWMPCVYIGLSRSDI